MTLLDAPRFDEARARRQRLVLSLSTGVVAVLVIVWWLVAGRPVDWPWNWNSYMFGRAAVNHFLEAIEKSDLAAAYGVWTYDKDWQQHQAQHSVYPFSRFEQDWSSTSPDNEYGAIHGHRIAAARMYGNVLLVAVFINGRKSDALNLDYDPKTKTLSFSPPGVQLYLGP
jgi:hypothetical protein